MYVVAVVAAVGLKCTFEHGPGRAGPSFILSASDP